jgi:hypothetical protein
VITLVDEHGQAHEWGTAAQIAEALTSPDRRITAARVRDWGRRASQPGDPLYRLLPHYHRPGPRRGTTWYPLRQAAEVERLTRRTAPVVPSEAGPACASAPTAG